MFLLDTNIISLLLRGSAPDTLLNRVTATPPEARFISSVTVVEILEGALALIRREESLRRGTTGHSLLVRLMHDLSDFPILEYDEAADRAFAGMPAALKRKGSRDCRIAACALRYGCVLVTQNTRDFAEIPGLMLADWTTTD